MIDPGNFRETILAVVVLGGGALVVEQYIRTRAWPRSQQNGPDCGKRTR